jgi:integrase
MTRALADGYRAELIRTARKGLAFAPGTGEPESWAVAEPEPVTWYQHAVAYAEMKWPHLAPHSRASLADALATVTPLLTRETGRRPPAQTLRAALYGHAFNARRRCRAPGPGTASALAWLERASLPVGQLGDPRVIRAALDGLCTRLDGSPAAAKTITRKRAVFHGALGYAVELGLLPASPIGLVRWRAPRAAPAVSPATVASPAQVRAILAEVCRIRPELAAFFGCLCYAALRPEEAVTLRRDDLILPARGRGKVILTAACPRTGSAWTNTGKSHQPAGLKHRPGGAIRVVPIPPVLVSMLCHHLGDHGTTPDGRLFRGARGGMLSESVYGRVWHAALSLWLNASGTPAEVAARAGNSARVLHEVYLHCTDGRDDTVSQRIEDALNAGTGITHSSPRAKATGYTHRRHRPRPCPLSVREPARSPTQARPGSPRGTTCRHPLLRAFPQFRRHFNRNRPDAGRRPDPARA